MSSTILDSPLPKIFRTDLEYFPPTPTESSPTSSPIEPSAPEVSATEMESSIEMPHDLSNGHINGQKSTHAFETAQHGAHSSIVLNEWSNLTERIENKKALFLDLHDLTIANVAAVSR